MTLIKLPNLIAVLYVGICFCSAGCKASEKESKETGNDTTTYAVSAEKLAIIESDDVTIQIDPSFAYYQGRSAESIVDEVLLAGFKAVHYFVVNENHVNGELIHAFHEKGIRVWLLTLGNGTYSTADYPAGWEQWKMGLSKRENGVDGFTFLSPFNKDFVEWKKKSLVYLMTKYPFDGLELAESYFPEWDAISKGTYGDVGPNAQQAFKEQYDLDIPDFADTQAPNHYTRQPDVYKKWVEFRVQTVNGFLHELINGKGGVREARPDALIATWSLAINQGPGSFNKLREDQGLDAASMVGLVKPDVHFFQTHWPDWVKPESALRPDYMKDYQPFVDQLKQAHPTVPVGLQADIGSAKNMIKSAYWVKEFDKAARKYGYTTWTSYEYHLGGYIYTEKPLPRKAVRKNTQQVTVSFNKRIDETIAKDRSNYTFFLNGESVAVDLQDIRVDGNQLTLVSAALPAEGFEIAFRNITDTPQLWLYKDFPANKIPEGIRIKVP